MYSIAHFADDAALQQAAASAKENIMIANDLGLS
jgi:hypothetical protein